MAFSRVVISRVRRHTDRTESLQYKEIPLGGPGGLFGHGNRIKQRQ